MERRLQAAYTGFLSENLVKPIRLNAAIVNKMLMLKIFVTENQCITNIKLLV
jgi:hypothetical protein